MAIYTLAIHSQSYLGAQNRRLRGKLGAPKAITDMAHKLAVLVYRMLGWGHEYVDKGMQYYEERHREQQIRLLKSGPRNSDWRSSERPGLLIRGRFLESAITCCTSVAVRIGTVTQPDSGRM